MGKRMSLSAYVSLMKKRADDFEEMWRNKNADPKQRKDWPLDADSVYDWDEQFRAWMDWPES